MANDEGICAGGIASPAFLALGCVGFIASAPAWGQAPPPPPDDKDATELQGVVVTDTAVDEGSYKVDRSASPKFTAPLLDTPRSIVVVPAQVIKDTGSATLVEALRTVPGITFGAAEGGNPIGDRPFIRGFDTQGSTFLDGVRDIGAQTREVFAIDSIEVVRGSDSTFGGRGNAGGTINIVSKLPKPDTFAAASASYGTADYKRITADVNYRLSDMVAVRFAGMWHDQDVAGRDAIFQKRWGVAPSFTIGVDGPTRLTVAYYHLDTDELPDSGIPYAYTATNTPNLGYSYSEPAIGDFTTAGGVTGRVGRGTFYGLKDRDFRDTRTDQATLRVEHEFGDHVTVRNTSRYSHTFQAYIYTQPDDSQGNVYGTSATNPAGPAGSITNGGYVWRRANTRYGTTDTVTNQTDLFGTFDTGGIKHSFAAGSEFSWEKAPRGAYVTRGFVNAAGNELLSTGSTISPRCNTATIARYYCASLFNPNPNDPWVNYASDTSNLPAAIVKTLPIAETINHADTRGAYLADSISISDALIVNLGIRYDRFHSEVQPGLPITATTRYTISRTDDGFNYQAGAVFKPTPNTSVYASFATSASPPNTLVGEGQEQNGLGTITVVGAGATQAQIDAARAVSDALKVEKSKSYEVGAKADLFAGQLSLNVAAFRTETKNARATSDIGTVAFIGERRIKGVEFGFNGSVTAAWSVFGGYTYLDARIVDGGFTSFAVPAVTGPGGVVLVPARTIVQPSVNTGRQFPQTAKHSFTIWSDYKVTPALSIGGGAFYTSRVFGGYADNRAVSGTGLAAVVNPATKIIARSVPGYWRFDARAGYRISDHLDVSVNVQNLTDKTYFNQAYSSHYASIAPGRSAFATLNVRY